MRLMRFAALLVLPFVVVAQHGTTNNSVRKDNPPVEASWKEEQVTDQLRGTTYSQFSLTGKFLTPPSKADAPPVMVVKCIPGKNLRGKTNGKFSSGYIIVGDVVDTRVSGGSSVVTVQYRLDDGKLQSEPWGRSTDFAAIFISNPDCPFCGNGYEVFANLLYGHHTYHKENTNPQVKKVVLGVPEYLGGEIVMQFDLPDSTEVAETCGIIMHK